MKQHIKFSFLDSLLFNEGQKPFSLLTAVSQFYFLVQMGLLKSSACHISQRSGSSGAGAPTFRHNYCITQQSSQAIPLLSTHHPTPSGPP